MGLLIHSKSKVKLKGDKSLSKRDFFRVIKPLKRFGANFESNLGKLPIIIKGTNKPNPIVFNETKGSAQVKSSVMLVALNTKGETIIKAKKSNYTGDASTIINDTFNIGCNDGSIEPLFLQREGKNIISKDDFLRGYSFQINDIINA